MKISATARNTDASTADELAAIINRFTPVDGEHKTAIPALSFYRYSAKTEPECGLTKAALVLAAQGAKRVNVGGRAYDYDRTRCLITSVDLPMQSHVTVASPERPYLCLVLALDLQRIADLITEMRLPRSDAPAGHAIAVSNVTESLRDAALRLARLLKTPRDIPILAPLIEQEILYRLLISEQGARLRHIATADSQTYKIAKAIEWLRNHFSEPLRIDELAQRVAMSASSLHHHFKDVTSMSPLQYQKQLRLHEARRLLVRQACDVGSAALRVGYESPSQFSREYNRLFGAPPLRDAVLLRKIEAAV